MVEIIVTTEHYTTDPDSRAFLDYINTHSKKLGLDKAVAYYEFPTYADYEGESFKPDVLLLSPIHGVIALKFASDKNFFSTSSEVNKIDHEINEFSSQLYSRLLKSKSLKKGMREIKLAVTPVIFAITTDGKIFEDEDEEIQSTIIQSYDSFQKLLLDLTTPPLRAADFSETRSVIEGAKAITRAQKRVVLDAKKEIYADALSKLESEIANFDERQRKTALSLIQGPQRIRGLAGSGKTVILAMKAAHIHLTHPEAQILVTFYTKALRTTLENLISKFYRHFRDEQPNWDKVHVRHGWGSQSRLGVYSATCKRHNIVPLTFGDAQPKRGAKDAFDYVCSNLLQTVKIKPYYDYILIDEGQDFPTSFYELAFFLTKGERDKKSIIWAYDELQNILNVKMRSPSELYGLDEDGKPRIDLDRAQALIPKFSSNDIVLSKCYRNQGEVLVTAHALGLGLYGENIVQLLQNEEHWSDVGYSVQNSPLRIGKEANIIRPEENSPLSLRDIDGESTGNVIEFFTPNSIEEEVKWIADNIEIFLKGGLKPEDIVVIALDDRNARGYFKYISELLSTKKIESNNIIADPYSEPPFFIEGKVTLSTVYRAKGNEAAVVFACGIDAINSLTRLGRNKIFAAFTRSKAWLRISGIGIVAHKYEQEVSQALSNYPFLKFVMPDPEKIETIQRDLSTKVIKAKKAKEKYIKELKNIGLSDEEISELELGTD